MNTPRPTLALVPNAPDDAPATLCATRNGAHICGVHVARTDARHQQAHICQDCGDSWAWGPDDRDPFWRTQDLTSEEPTCASGDGDPASGEPDDLDEAHRPEISVKVYLEWHWDAGRNPSTGRWVVAPVTVDGEPLDSGLDPWGAASTCDITPCNRLHWKAQHAHADQAGLPNAAELTALLQEALDSQRRDR